MSRPFRLVVAGGRDFQDPAFLDQALQRSLQDYGPAELLQQLDEAHPYGPLQIVSGGARGADALGEQWAKAAGVPIQRYPAAWDDIGAPGAVVRTNRQGRPYNANAGFARNALMAQNADAVLVMPGGRGTDHMVKVAQEQGLPVWDARGGSLDAIQLLAAQKAAAAGDATFLIDSTASHPIGRQFSPLVARLSDGRTIEEAYQQAKGYPSWKQGKGRPAKVQGFDYEGVYRDLYSRFAQENPALMDELAQASAGARLVHPRARTTQNPAVVLTELLTARQASPAADATVLPGAQRAFQVVSNRGKFDVLGMRQNGQTMATVKAPGEPGWLGNPYVADDAGGRYTRQQATEKFGELIREKAADPQWRAALLGLEGKRIGYYKPEEEFIHLNALSDWIQQERPQATTSATAKVPVAEQLSFFDDARRFAGQAWPWMAGLGGSAALVAAAMQLQSSNPEQPPYPPA